MTQKAIFITNKPAIFHYKVINVFYSATIKIEPGENWMSQIKMFLVLMFFKLKIIAKARKLDNVRIYRFSSASESV